MYDFEPKFYKPGTPLLSIGVPLLILNPIFMIILGFHWVEFVEALWGLIFIFTGIIWNIRAKKKYLERRRQRETQRQRDYGVS